MRRFKHGQEVICLGTNWRIEKKLLFFFKRTVKSNGPKLNDIVTVDFYNGDHHITLKEYTDRNGVRDAYQENLFEPVLPTEMIEELMNEINEPAPCTEFQVTTEVQ